MSGSYSSTNGFQYSTYNAEPSDSGSAEFKRLSQVIGTNIQKVDQNVASMQKMVGQLGTLQDSETLRSKLHQVQHYTKQLVNDTNNHLKELSHLPSPSLQSEQRDRKLLKERLASQFGEALKNLQQQQRASALKEKESVMRARANSGLSGNPFDDGTTSGSNLIDLASPSAQQTQMMTSLQMEEEVNLELLREREEAVRKLETDICDVNQIFKDLATLVHEQGDVIDSIEANVEHAQIQVSEGTQQLAKARQHQTSARKKMLCFIVFGLVAVAVIVTLAIVLSGKN